MRFLEDIDWVEALTGVLVVVILFFFALLVADLFVTQPYTVDGQVIGAEYKPSSTGIGNGISSSGKPVVVVTSESEKWVLVVRVGGKVESYEVSPDMFYSVKIGDSVSMQCRQGKFIGIVSCSSAVPE